MAKPTTKTELLKSHAGELVKQHIEYDAADRASKVYTAMTNAKDNDACEVTEYIYRSPTSSQIVGRKEAYDVWDSAWDADFTVSEAD